MHQLKDSDCQSGSEKHDPTICFLKETHYKYIDIYRLKVNGWNIWFFNYCFMSSLYSKKQIIWWLKSGQGTLVDISPKKTYNDQHKYKKMLNIINLGNGNGHCNEILPHTC